MLQEAEIHFSVQQAIYNTAEKKAYYILTLFKTGNTKLWKEQYFRQQEGKTLCEGNDWDRFKATLWKSFKDVGSKDEAMTKLQQLNQTKGQAADEYNTKFRLLVSKAGLDEMENVFILIQLYSRGLNKDIGERIIMNSPPATLSGWMANTSTLNGYKRWANSFYANTITFPQRRDKKQWKSRNYKPKQRDEGGLMEIDRLEPQEEKRRKEGNLCYNCGKEGHHANKCRSPRNEGSMPQGSGNGKGKTPQGSDKKRTFQGNQQGGKQKPQIRTIDNDQDKAENTRSAIQKIISDSYQDQEADDYLDFI